MTTGKRGTVDGDSRRRIGEFFRAPFGCYYERFSNNVFQKKSVLGLQPVIAVNFGFQDLLSKSMDGTQRVWQFTFRD